MGKASKKKKPQPRPYMGCEMPVIEPCPHSFCIVERTKKGPILENPKGLPWSTGLLKALPGAGPKYVPYKFPEAGGETDKKTTGKGGIPLNDKEKKQAVIDVCEQMMFFLKIIMMANELLGDEPCGTTGKEPLDKEREEGTTALEQDQPPEQPPQPPPTEETPPE